MISRLFTVALLSLLAASCTRRVAGPVPPAGAGMSSTAVTMRRQVVNAADAGDGDARARALRRRILAEPGSLEARLDLAAHYRRMGAPELAIEHYRLAAERFPESAEVQVELAKALRAQSLAAEAAAGLAKFLEGRPADRKLAAAWSWLGILRDGLDDWAGAEAAHRSAVGSDPTNAALRNNLGYNLLLQGKREAAAAEFRRALEIQPGSEIARNNLGMALAARPADALSAWKTASGPAAAHNNLAAMLIEQGRYQEARRELNTALGYKRDYPAALRNLRILSELDGQPAAFSHAPVRPWWERLVRSVGRALAGTEPRKSEGAATTTASR